MDHENKVSKIFIIFLGSNIRERFQFKQVFELNRPYSEIWPAQLTNESVHTLPNIIKQIISRRMP